MYTKYIKYVIIYIRIRFYILKTKTNQHFIIFFLYTFISSIFLIFIIILLKLTNFFILSFVSLFILKVLNLMVER